MNDLQKIVGPLFIFAELRISNFTKMRGVLYNIHNEFYIPMKQVRVIKMCLNETCSRVWVGKNLSDMFPTRNGLKHQDSLSLLFSTLL
jgi:hypothetical protein